MFRLMPQPVVYRGTVAGLRISAVDGGATESGGAFIDGANASITALADGLHQIEIYDSAGRMIRGVLKAEGSAEGLTELIATADDRTFDSDTGFWTKGTNVTISGNKLNSAAGVGEYSSIAQRADLLSSPNGKLFKTVFDISDYTSGKVATTIGSFVGPPRNSVATYTEYLTGASVSSLFRFASRAPEFVGSIGGGSVSVVTTPSTSGATIVSAKGGTTWNFGYKNASFAYNAASYAVIVRKLR